jgi:hypothetical protein
MSAKDGRSVSPRSALAVCAAILTLVVQGTASGDGSNRPAGAQLAAVPALANGPVRAVTKQAARPRTASQVSLEDSPFLIEPRFPLADGRAADSASETLRRAGFLAEPPGAQRPPNLPEAEVAALGLSTAELRQEVDCLALNIYFEARNEPYEGQIAVAHVVLNRVSDPRFPETACEVIRQGGARERHRCQFSWWCDGLSDRPKNNAKWATSKALAEAVYWGRSTDPTAGALWYHADYVSPYWGRVFRRYRQIGRHIFYLDREQPTQIASRAIDSPNTP